MKINMVKVSNYMMNIGIITSIYSMYKIYDSKKGLPEGVCPINENNTILYINFNTNNILNFINYL